MVWLEKDLPEQYSVPLIKYPLLSHRLTNTSERFPWSKKICLEVSRLVARAKGERYAVMASESASSVPT
jgi:hypothetical protein